MRRRARRGDEAREYRGVGDMGHQELMGAGEDEIARSMRRYWAVMMATGRCGVSPLRRGFSCC